MSHLRRELGMLVALVLMCVGLWISNPDFVGQSNILNTTRQIAMLGTFAVGLAFVIITGGIDLSVGSIIGLTGVLIAKLSAPTPESFHLSYAAGISIALAVALLIGLTQGLLITRLNLQPFIVTLGFMLLLRGVSQTIVEGGTLGFGPASAFRRFANQGLISPPKVIPDFSFGTLFTGEGFRYALQNTGAVLTAYPVLIFLVVAILAAYALHFTVFGRYVYAIGGNRDAAEYSGINVKRIETLTYVISAGMAGVAGVCYAAYIGQMSQQVGIAYELYAIAGAVLGGVSLRGGEGSVLGVIIGTGIMRVIDNGITMFQFKIKDAEGGTRLWRLNENWNFIIIGAVILAAVILDQVAHIVQAKRRTQKAGDVAPAPAPATTAA